MLVIHIPKRATIAAGLGSMDQLLICLHNHGRETQHPLWGNGQTQLIEYDIGISTRNRTNYTTSVAQQLSTSNEQQDGDAHIQQQIISSHKRGHPSRPSPLEYPPQLLEYQSPR